MRLTPEERQRRQQVGDEVRPGLLRGDKDAQWRMWHEAVRQARADVAEPLIRWWAEHPDDPIGVGPDVGAYIRQAMGSRVFAYGALLTLAVALGVEHGELTATDARMVDLSMELDEAQGRLADAQEKLAALRRERKETP